MTVSGKGGRPRKWRSDADRVRDYRARQRGVDEPPTLAQALAVAEIEALRVRTRDLEAQLVEAQREIARLSGEKVPPRRAPAPAPAKQPAVQLSRAQRRQVEREQRHRRG